MSEHGNGFKYHMFSELHQKMPCYMEDTAFSEMSPMPFSIPANKMGRKVRKKIYNYSKNINIEEQEEDLQEV